MLREFYVVTRGSHTRSIYHVKAGFPVAKKIAMDGESRVALGEDVRIGEKFAVCFLLIAYNPNGPGPRVRFSTEEVGYMVWHSSPIVALFATEAEARRCFTTEDLLPSDPRFARETRAVCDAIGDDHPDFYVCKESEIRLGVFNDE